MDKSTKEYIKFAAVLFIVWLTVLSTCLYILETFGKCNPLGFCY